VAQLWDRIKENQEWINQMDNETLSLFGVEKEQEEQDIESSSNDAVVDVVVDDDDDDDDDKQQQNHSVVVVNVDEISLKDDTDDAMLAPAVETIKVKREENSPTIVSVECFKSIEQCQTTITVDLSWLYRDLMDLWTHPIPKPYDMQSKRALVMKSTKELPFGVSVFGDWSNDENGLISYLVQHESQLQHHVQALYAWCSLHYPSWSQCLDYLEPFLPPMPQTLHERVTYCVQRWPVLRSSRVMRANENVEGFAVLYLELLCCYHPEMWDQHMADIFRMHSKDNNVAKLTSLVESHMSQRRQEMWQLCEEYGLLKGLLLFESQNQQEWFRQLDVALDMDNMTYVQDKLLPRVQDWLACLNYVGSKQDVVRWMAGQCDDVDALIAFCKEHPKTLDAGVALALLQRKMQKQKHEMVQLEVLEALDTHLWAKKKPHLASQLDHDYEQLDFDYAGGNTPVFFEDGQVGHWGAHVALLNNVCPVCALKLVVDSTDQLIHIYRACGHAIHQACNSEDACVVCFSRGEKKKTLGI